MKMNNLEKFAMNNPIRSWIQRNIEIPYFIKTGGLLKGLTVLEIGCGRGVGTELIVKKLKAKQVIATDLDEQSIRLAKKRLKKYDSNQITLQVEDAANLQFKDMSFDAVINFAAIHHIPNWQQSVKEIARVLKPGGYFYFQEVTVQWISRFPWVVLFKHPKENRFTAQQFIEELEDNGLQVGEDWTQQSNGDFILGVAVKKS